MGEIGEAVTEVFSQRAAELADQLEAAASLAGGMQERFGATTEDSQNEHVRTLDERLAQVAYHLGAASAALADTTSAKQALQEQWGIGGDAAETSAPVTSTEQASKENLGQAATVVKLTAYEHRGLYEEMGIDLGRLGCVMVDTDPVQISDVIPPDALYYSKNRERFPHMTGIVSEEIPHATLLYGLLSPGPEIREQVDTMLQGWAADHVTIDHVGYFDNPKAEEPHYCLVAHLKPGGSLSEGNARLQRLPHINVHPPDYKPHLTLAWLKRDPAVVEACVRALNARLAGKRIGVRGINYGW